MSGMTQQQHNEIEMQIELLARQIARQKNPHTIMATAATPHEIARALWLNGWTPPVVGTQEDTP